MSDPQALPPSPRIAAARLEPGVRAARDRADLTQEEVAERMNVSIHTFRPWDRGTRKPARLEQRKLLALIVGTPIEVIWPPDRDRQVAEALRREAQRSMSPGGDGATRRPRAAAGSHLHETGEEIAVRRSLPSSASAPTTARAPADEQAKAETSQELAGRPLAHDEVGSAGERAHDLPPWPVGGSENEPQPVPNGRERQFGLDVPGEPAASFRPERDSDAIESLVTLAPSRASGRRTMRVTVAIGVSIVLGGAATSTAIAVNDRAADAGTPSQASAGTSAGERKRILARSGQVAEMLNAAERRDYDAAIAAAEALGDRRALERYQRDAASVLVRRADAAARRGDLPLARKRLRLAKKYAAVPGASDVQARIRRIQEARRERAERRRASARRQARSASVAQASSGSAASPSSAESSASAPSGDSSSTTDGSPPSGSSSSTASPSPSAGSSGSGADECRDGCGLGPFP